MAASIVATGQADEIQSRLVRPGVMAYGNLDYSGNGNKRQMLDLYIPLDAKGPLPVIVWFYGGGWLAGGHLAALLGTSNGVKDLEGTVGKNQEQSSTVQAAVSISGPTDLTLPNQPSALMDPFNRLVGGSVEKNKAVAIQASPVSHVGKHSAPMLIVHGQADAIVPIKHAEVLEAAMKKDGVEVKLLALKDTGHVGGKIDAPETRKEIADFFARHLKPDKAATTGPEGDK